MRAQYSQSRKFYEKTTVCDDRREVGLKISWFDATMSLQHKCCIDWKGSTMNVYHYTTAGGKDLILDYINSLSKEEIIDGLSVLEKFEKDELDTLSIKTWQGKISEIYFYKHNRLFYVIVDGKDAYMLHACRKQKNKTEKHDSEIIIKRAKELGEQLSKKFI